MNHLIIRAYKKDDYLARLCYESWMLSGYEGKIYFFDEDYKPLWTKGIAEHIQREPVANFGGQLGANCLRNCIYKLDVKEDDIVISCDTDITILGNPLNDFKADFAGNGGLNEHGFIHISGQCMIMKGWLAKQIADESQSQFHKRWTEMDLKGINICDDTYFSYFAHEINAATQIIKGKWLHEKLYYLEGRTDFETIINDLKRNIR